MQQQQTHRPVANTATTTACRLSDTAVDHTWYKDAAIPASA